MTLSDYTAIQPSVVYSLLGIGSVLLTWALFWNRARGRKRCPTCWYDMADAPSLVCPECGRDARSEERLTKTRRRKRWAACALFLLAGSYAAHVGPAAHARGWPALVPTSIAVFVAPLPDNTNSAVWTPLWREVHEDRDVAWWWQKRVLLHRMAASYQEVFPVVRAPESVERGHPIEIQIGSPWWVRSRDNSQIQATVAFGDGSGALSIGVLRSTLSCSMGLLHSKPITLTEQQDAGMDRATVMIDVALHAWKGRFDPSRGIWSASSDRDLWRQHLRLQIKIVDPSSVRDMALTPLSRSAIPEDDARIQPVIVHVYCY